MTLHTTIVIPARYGSTRLPGKPLVNIAGQTMLQRVVAIANTVKVREKNITVLVATDDERIVSHCQDIGVDAVMTPIECPSGTDRVAKAIEAVEQQGDVKSDFILNLQGDAPLTPPEFLTAMITAFQKSSCDVVTPVTQLTWDELDTLRENKLKTPFSGTCAILHPETGKALWFSKNIVPAIRNENQLRKQEKLSPIFRHIGLYGYSRQMLSKYNTLKESHYERLEGLEQLRIIENGYTIQCVRVNYKNYANMSGVDSQEDIERAEAFIKANGELISPQKGILHA